MRARRQTLGHLHDAEPSLVEPSEEFEAALPLPLGFGRVVEARSDELLGRHHDAESRCVPKTSG